MLFSLLNTESRILQKICKIDGAFSTSLFIWHYPILVFIWGMDVVTDGVINRISVRTFILITSICFGWALFSSMFIESKLFGYLKNILAKKTVKAER